MGLSCSGERDKTAMFTTAGVTRSTSGASVGTPACDSGIAAAVANRETHASTPNAIMKLARISTSFVVVIVWPLQQEKTYRWQKKRKDKCAIFVTQPRPARERLLLFLRHCR